MPSNNKDLVGDTTRSQSQPNQNHIVVETPQNRQAVVGQVPEGDSVADGHVKMDSEMIDLNMKPHRMHEHIQ